MIDWLTRIGLCGVVCIALGAGDRAQVQEYRVGTSGKPWCVVLRLAGYSVNEDGVRGDGRRYFFASNAQSGVNVSLTLERVSGQATRAGCRQNLRRMVQANGRLVDDVQYSESDRYSLVAYTIAEYQGRKLDQRFFRACTVRGDVYVDFNLSKVGFKKGEEALFAPIIEESSFEDRPEPARTATSRAYLVEGSARYSARDFRGAIGPYEKALELEKQQRQLPRILWCVLIDNLGMAHGMTGNIARAKEIFEYGVSQDATYPMFHYNLACAHAETGDKTSAMEELVRAFDLKANVLPGEQMPDPRTDDSFKALMKDKEFRELAERLAKQQ